MIVSRTCTSGKTNFPNAWPINAPVHRHNEFVRYVLYTFSKITAASTLKRINTRKRPRTKSSTVNGRGQFPYAVALYEVTNISTTPTK